MLVSTVNDIRIYNLSAGKSLPDWLSDRKRRKLNQQDDGWWQRVLARAHLSSRRRHAQTD
jgi:ribosome biogenesis protein ENP2